MKPLIGVVPGDPNGVGPELTAKLLAADDVRDNARVVIIGDRRVVRMGAAVAGVTLDTAVTGDIKAADFTKDGYPLFDVPAIEPGKVTPGRATADAGWAAYLSLQAAVALAKAGDIDGFCFAPLNKQALKMGGSPHGDEHVLFAELLGHTGPCCEHNVLDNLWTVRATSHIPLKDVARHITLARVIEITRLAHDTLGNVGVTHPRIGVCALNPHGGDGGLFGREEIDVIAPAVQQATQQGIDVQGPFPADIVFVRAGAGDFDAVVTMFHDQGQIAMKLMGFGKGITVSGGLPVPIATPASGTAFDIAGRGIANAEGLRQAFFMVCRMANLKRG